MLEELCCWLFYFIFFLFCLSFCFLFFFLFISMLYAFDVDSFTIIHYVSSCDLNFFTNPPFFFSSVVWGPSMQYDSFSLTLFLFMWNITKQISFSELLKLEINLFWISFELFEGKSVLLVFHRTKFCWGFYNFVFFFASEIRSNSQPNSRKLM